MSHAHTDAPLARALDALIMTVFDEVDVDYSSDVSARGGIEAGTDWQKWVLAKIRSCDMAVVVLTPESLSRPWLMWESGAVCGIALALEQQPQIVPLLFRVNRERGRSTRACLTDLAVWSRQARRHGSPSVCGLR